jgi:HK97 family phage major capsid protein
MHRNNSAGGIHPDAIELAGLLRPSWPEISARIAQSGAPTCEVAEAPLKEKLKKIEAELDEKRDALAEASEAREAAKKAYAGSEEISQDSAEFREAMEANRAYGEIADEIANLQAVQIGTLKMLGKDAPAPSGDRPAGDSSDPRGWDSTQLFATDMGDGKSVGEYLASMANRKARVGDVKLGEVITRDAFAAEVTGTEDMRRGQWLGVVPQLRRRLRIVDILPVATMDENVLPYTKESGAFTGAKPTKEGEAKPESSITFTDAEATARTIAVYQKIRKQVLSDVAAMRGIIDSRLRYLVERKLEEEILGGKGADPELEGILHTTGLGVVKYTASPATDGAYIAEQALRAITTVFLADAEVDGLVIAPTDWQSALLAKANYEASAGVTGGSGEFIGGGPFSTTPAQLWGVPLIVSATMKENEVLAGAFGLGAQLFIREGVNVLVSDSDQDDFIKNKLTLLAEMRAALAVYRPAAFAKAWLTKTAEEAGN